MIRSAKVFKSEDYHFTSSLLIIYTYYLKKKEAYAANDSFGRFMVCEDFGIDTVKSLALRIQDKFSILRNQLNPASKPKANDLFDENVSETIIDISTYSCIALVFFNVERPLLVDPHKNCDIFLKDEIRRCYAQYLLNRRRYTKAEDFLQNFYNSTLVGIPVILGCILRMIDKFTLLQNFLIKPNLKHNETVEDTFRDLVSYGALTIYLLEYERK